MNMLRLVFDGGRRTSFSRSLPVLAQAALVSTAVSRCSRYISSPCARAHRSHVFHALPLATVSNGMAASSGAGTDAVAVYVTVPDIKLGTCTLITCCRSARDHLSTL